MASPRGSAIAGADSCSVDKGNWVERGCTRGGGSSSAQSRSMDVGGHVGKVSGVDGMLLRGEVGGEAGRCNDHAVEVINVNTAVQFNENRGGEPGAGLQQNVRVSVATEDGTLTTFWACMSAMAASSSESK
ncbi:hypothetical protein FISHEDRAFT_62982 [Fistulina hepatica ATCC 64428]|uniref:Uncharacterized protein n=1 Tax=Fistulina hepatica ATCC 64428 TaxID=1128425 RepID=A0A0D7A0V9_9AGAR|nr:hypothetical protein FISHEDRAFT_62982 [Fistulina hepatica ATCC 64428]